MLNLQRRTCLVLGSFALVACQGAPFDHGDNVSTGGQTSTLASSGAGGAISSGGTGSVGTSSVANVEVTDSSALSTSEANAVSASRDVVLFASWQETMSGTGIMMFVASIHNGTGSSIFVDSKCTADWRRLEGDTWVPGASVANVCPSAIVNLVELPAGRTFYATNAFSLPAFGPGTYGLRGRYWMNCASGRDCVSSIELSSQTVWVASNASQTIATPVGPGGLHATCTKDGPCSAGQTAIAYTGTGDTCTCEIPCVATSMDCPSGTACSFVSAPLGSMCY
jgi:hypothetical protein